MPLVKTVLLAAAGNLLEWYDFACFGIFAPYIALQFFPQPPEHNATCQVIANGEKPPNQPQIYAYALFAGGFIVRPIGGALFGIIGDRKGRAFSLMLTILMMAAPTLGIALLPGYRVIGKAAPVALTGLRLIQGLAVGGELPGALVYAVESAPPTRIGTFGALVQATGVRHEKFVKRMVHRCLKYIYSVHFFLSRAGGKCCGQPHGGITQGGYGRGVFVRVGLENCVCRGRNRGSLHLFHAASGIHNQPGVGSCPISG